MKLSIGISAVLACAVLCLSTLSIARCQETLDPGIRADNPNAAAKLTPQEKANSDALMASGLTTLQSASAELQSGDASGALTNLRTAYTDMKQAAPIYHGYRDKALIETKAAGKALDVNKRNSRSRAALRLSNAISHAQTAVQNW